VLMQKYVPKEDERSVDYRMVHNLELRNIYRSPISSILFLEGSNSVQYISQPVSCPYTQFSEYFSRITAVQKRNATLSTVGWPR
jgi:hypothetical protein